MRKLWYRLLRWFRRNQERAPLTPPTSGYRFVVKSDRGRGLALAVETDDGAVARRRYEEELHFAPGDVEFWDAQQGLRGLRRR